MGASQQHGDDDWKSNNKRTRAPDCSNPMDLRRFAISLADPVREFVQSLPEKLLDGTVPVATPVAARNATTFGSITLEDFAALKKREEEGNLRDDEGEYVRYGTPLTKLTETQLASLYGSEEALVFASGMAAIEKTLEAVLADGGHIIVFEQGYRQTNALLERWAGRPGHWVKVTSIPIEGFADIHSYLRDDTRAVFFETPSNPFLRVIDIRSVKEQLKAAESDALLIVDDTFSPPPNQRPLQRGADLVVISLTKYLTGTNQVLAGAVVGSKQHLASIRSLRSQCGTIAHDHDCQGVLQGLDTLFERLDRANKNGAAAAQLLASSPLVTKLFYPGNSRHPDYEIARMQMEQFGGVVSFCIDARDLREVAAFTNAFISSAPEGTYIAPSFGGDLPLISPVAVVSHFQQSPEERARRGIPINLIRLSCGTIPQEQLTNALMAGLEALERFKKEALPN